jgi:methionyl-tRNA formyltransferase
MRIIFLGTPEFAKQVLKNLINSEHEVVAVVTQPDKPFGRSGKLQPSAVKQFALEHNLKVLQFERIKSKVAVKELKALNADLMVTAAYGQILSQEVLDITPLGVFNVHGSLLPKYRGAAPIQWAVISGETVTGITIMKTDIGMDTGDMLLKEELIIEPKDTAGDVFEKMSKLAGKVMLKALDLLKSGNYKLEKQNEEEATHFPMLKKEDGKIDFNKTASQIVNLVRGVNPWPGAFTYLNNQILKVHKATEFVTEDEQINEKINKAQAGQVVIASAKLGLIVKAKNSAIRLNQIQAVGAKIMEDKAYLNGKIIQEGTELGGK